MKRPTTKKEDLAKYAHYRAKQELKDLLKVDRAVADGAETEDVEEYREPIGIDKYTEIKLTLSWGGDGDGFKIRFDANDNPVSGVYYWEDWGVCEEVDLTDDEIRLVCDIYYVEGLLEKS